MNIPDAITYIQSGGNNSNFAGLYGAENVPYQVNRYIEGLTAFQAYFNLPGNTNTAIYSAPGRTEISGNHTDHQQGRIMAASVGMDILAFVAPCPGKIRIKSHGYDEIILAPDQPEPSIEDRNASAGLVKGILGKLTVDGYKTGGFLAYIISDVAQGSGLSSSAAYEALIGVIISHEFNGGQIDPVTIAKAGQYAENHYFGKPCGLMDQVACAVGGLICVDFQKPEDPVIEKIDLHIEAYKYKLYAVNTGSDHSDLTNAYAAIPREMEQVANYFGKDKLRDVDQSAFYGGIPRLKELMSHRAILRAIHFFEENTRVKHQMEALKKGNFNHFLSLVMASGQSSFCCLQNIYVSEEPQKQDISLALALSNHVLNGEGACRVHGGGFAGTVIAFVPMELENAYIQTLNNVFGENACFNLYIRPVGICKIL